jgi:hypothetical protein
MCVAQPIPAAARIIPDLHFEVNPTRAGVDASHQNDAKPIEIP